MSADFQPIRMPASLADCAPCKARGVTREAVDDLQLWPRGPWAYVCEYCAYRLRSQIERAERATREVQS